MKLSIELTEADFLDNAKEVIIKEALAKCQKDAVKKIVENINIKKLTESVELRIENAIIDVSVGENYYDRSVQGLDEKIAKVVEGISDEFLKNQIMSRLLQKIR